MKQTDEERLKALMQKGYNIQIECKSTQRVYALTYEAMATLTEPDAEQNKNLPFILHGVGDTLSELLDNLEEILKIQIDLRSGSHED